MDINPLDIVIHIINIVVLFVILRALLYKPVSKFMQKRAERVQAELDAAKKDQQTAEELKQKYSASLQSAQAEASEQAAQIIQKASSEANDIVAAAQKEAERIVAEAGKKAEENRKKTLASAREDMKALSLAMAEKILAREVNEADNRKIIDAFFAAAEKDGAQ